MRRFVTYLYECERGNKSKNVGFIRVNVRGEEGRMEIFLRNLLRGKDTGKMYAFVHKKELVGIKLTEFVIENGQGDSQLLFSTGDIVDSGFTLQDIAGIGIRMDSGTYIASCWEDAYAEEITRGEFVTGQVEEEVQLEVAEETVLQSPIVMTETEPNRIATYEKIDLSQIRDLPSPNWHFTTNSFLVHGFFNYGYLVLKKEMAENKETLSLGVPGIFEKPEAVMAVLFGFPSFAEIPAEIIATPMNQKREFASKEKNQEAEVGAFGCWFVNLKM